MLGRRIPSVIGVLEVRVAEHGDKRASRLNPVLGEQFDYHAATRMVAEPTLRALGIPYVVLLRIDAIRDCVDRFPLSRWSLQRSRLTIHRTTKGIVRKTAY